MDNDKRLCTHTSYLHYNTLFWCNQDSKRLKRILWDKLKCPLCTRADYVVQTVKTISDFKKRDENNTNIFGTAPWPFLTTIIKTFHISQSVSTVKRFMVLSQTVHLHAHAQPHPIPHVYSNVLKLQLVHIGAPFGITAESTASGAECASTGHGHLGDFQQATREELQKQSF